MEALSDANPFPGKNTKQIHGNSFENQDPFQIDRDAGTLRKGLLLFDITTF